MWDRSYPRIIDTRETSNYIKDLLKEQMNKLHRDEDWQVMQEKLNKWIDWRTGALPILPHDEQNIVSTYGN